MGWGGKVTSGWELVWGGRSSSAAFDLDFDVKTQCYCESKPKSKAAGQGARPTQDYLESVDAGDALADDQGVDVVRAFVGLH